MDSEDFLLCVGGTLHGNQIPIPSSGDYATITVLEGTGRPRMEWYEILQADDGAYYGVFRRKNSA